MQLRNIVKEFPVKSGAFLKRGTQRLQAVAGVSLELHRGETVGLVGESGCGKSTLARCVVRLMELSAGEVIFDGHDISKATHT